MFEKQTAEARVRTTSNSNGPRSSSKNSRLALVVSVAAFIFVISAIVATMSGSAASPAPAPPLPPNCTAPGLTILNDASGDETSMQPAHDIQSLSVAEPGSVGAGKIMFVLKVASLSSVPPDTSWNVSFKVGATNYIARMTTVPPGSTGTPVFDYYQGVYNSALPASAPADAASSYSTDGTIKIVVPRSGVGNPAVGANLTDFLVRVSVLAGAVFVTPDSMPDNLAPTGTYQVVGSENCGAATPTPTPTPSSDPACTSPGVITVTDTGTNDATDGQANHDIISTSVAYPFTSVSDPDRLYFTIKVGSLSTLTPSTFYYTTFTIDGAAEAAGNVHGARMVVDAAGAATFESYIAGASNAGTVDGRFVASSIPAEAGSNYNANGAITIIVKRSDVGAAPNQTLTNWNGAVAQTAGGVATAILDGMPSTTGTPVSTISRGGNSFLIKSNQFCNASATPTPTPSPTATATPTPATGIPRFQNYTPPSTASYNGGEPSIGVNWLTGKVMYLASFSAVRIGFDDCSSPARDTWTNTNAPSAASLDPILFTDHMRAQGDLTPNRTFVSQLTGQDSITFFTDDDGATYLPSQGGGIPSGVDHQTIGAGPYKATTTPPVPPHPTYPNAVYYCSQDVATAFCARSDDGGITFGAGVPIYNLTQCTGIHGHVKVGPDGSVYVPDRSCGGRAAVVVSNDNGITWTVRPVPTSSSTGFLVDPSVGIGTNNVGKPAGQASNTIYLGYQASDSHARVAVSHDQGVSWSNDQDVGAPFGLVNTTFPELVAGDDNRAAYAFYGTTVAGNYTDQAGYNQSAPWHLYIATTFDAGLTWTTVDATPTDPVQRGSICNLGTTTCNGHAPNDRNLLDFMDATVDAQGRTLVGYPDGCVGGCVNGTTNSYTARAAISRQSGGKRLFAVYDPNPAEPVAPAPPRVDSVFKDGAGAIQVLWSVPDNGGSPITGYKVYRRTSSGGYAAPLAVLPAGTTTYADATNDPNTSYFYKVTAVNAISEGLNCGEYAIAAAPPTNPCQVPGYLVNTDPTGDQLLAPNNSDLDVQSVSIAEPGQPDSVNRLVFTMKVADLSTIPADRQWRIIWTPQVAPSTPGTDRYYVGMNSTAGGAAGVTFEYGVVTASGNVPIISGTPDAGTFTAAGVIQITIANNRVGNPGAGAVLGLVSGRNFAGNGNASLGKATAIDSTADSTYTLVGNAACANTAPFAALSGSPTSGTAPLTVNFSGAGSSDPDAGDSIVSYSFNFGDGSPVATQASPAISHTYNSVGNYNATLTVTDSHGAASAPSSPVTITVTQAGLPTNYALTTNGGVATASTTFVGSRSYPTEAAINGDRSGGGWEGGTGGWNDNTRGAWEDWLQVAFSGQAKSISEIRVYTLQNNFRSPVEPDASTPADVNGILDFEVQYWNGTAWVTVPGGAVTGNDKAMRVFTFTPVTTTMVRVLVHNGRVYYSRIVELEAYGTSGQP